MRCAVVGLGAISRLHLQALASMRPEVELCAVCDCAEGGEVEAYYGKRVPFYRDYETMLQEARPDAVHICTPHFCHAPMVVKALRRGIFVFLEKPVCISPAELEAVLQAEAASTAKVCVCLQNRFLPANEKAMALLSSGELGEVQGGRGFVTWKRDGDYYTKSPWRGKRATEGGSVLMNQAIHTLDLLLWYLGDPKRVQGAVGNYLNLQNDTEDTAHLYLEYEGEKRAVFYATNTFCRSRRILWEICCEKGILRGEGANLFLDDKLLVKEQGTAAGKAVWGAGHEILIRRFYDAVSSGAPMPVPLAEGARALQVIWSLYRSCGVMK